ncbi:unnamed protein product [Phytophthora lilii]|uniref:Unnamed protein product n=1 Tax=Phytophthora lilii TaxID=2077276 RepID=A0A9W6WW35_9STRA|nr:unnamed protein product [Phytophthora lilii]
MPRKAQGSGKRSGRHRRRSYSSSSSSSSYFSSSSSELCCPVKPLRHASTTPASMGPTMMPAQRAPAPTALTPFSTLYLTIHSAQNVLMKSHYAYCKTFVANRPMVENTMFAALSGVPYQCFKTNIVEESNNQPVWNARFEIRISDPSADIVSILLKNQQMLCCPIVGVCVISLKSLIDSPGVDQWFALRKGPFQTGHIRLQMLLKKIEQPTIPPRVLQANQINYSAAPMACPVIPPQQDLYTHPDRARSLDNDYRHRKLEKRHQRELKKRERLQRSLEKGEIRSKTSENVKSANTNGPTQAIAHANQANSDEVLSGHCHEVQLSSEKATSPSGEVRSERSGSFHSIASHTSSKSGYSNHYQRKASKMNSHHGQGDERLALDDDLYGGSDRMRRIGARENPPESCKSEPIRVPERMTEEPAANITQKTPASPEHKTKDDDYSTPAQFDGIKQDCPGQTFSDPGKANNEKDLAFSDSDLSSSSESSESRRRRRKHKSKKRRTRRRHKHRSQNSYQPDMACTILPEIPAYVPAPIGVIPPPPPPANKNGMGKFVSIASRVASIALLGADYTKAFTNTTANQAGTDVTMNVAPEGIPVVAENEDFEFA